MDKFLVWNTEAGLPTFAHDTIEAAINESERLATLNPGQTFRVMAHVGYSTVARIYRENDDWQYRPF